MLPRINWKRFLLIFTVLEVMILCAGCSAAWLNAISNLLPLLENAVAAALAFAASLEGKTVPTSVLTAVQKIFTDTQTQIANLKTLIASATASATQGVIAEINSVAQAIQANLSSILSGFSVTDTNTVSKFGALVGIAISILQTILGAIPLVTSFLAHSVTDEQMKAEAGNVKKHADSLKKACEESYVTIRTSPTENSDVNVALEALPEKLA